MDFRSSDSSDGEHVILSRIGSPSRKGLAWDVLARDLDFGGNAVPWFLQKAQGFLHHLIDRLPYRCEGVCRPTGTRHVVEPHNREITRNTPTSLSEIVHESHGNDIIRTENSFDPGQSLDELASLVSPFARELSVEREEKLLAPLREPREKTIPAVESCRCTRRTAHIADRFVAYIDKLIRDQAAGRLIVTGY